MENEYKTLIIIPAYNEKDSIGNTLKKLLKYTKNKKNIDICVINDGSTDETAEIVKGYNVILIDLPINLGIGGAVQTGYKYAYKNNYDLAIQFDADGQHKQEELDKIIEPTSTGSCDLCIGGRFVKKTNYKGTLTRRLGIYYFEKLLKLLTGKKITDPTSGFRCINKNVISILANEYPKDYPEPEVIMMLNKKGLSIKEVSVEMKERESGSSSITPLRSLYYMIKVSLSIIVRKIEKRG